MPLSIYGFLNRTLENADTPKPLGLTVFHQLVIIMYIFTFNTSDKWLLCCGRRGMRPFSTKLTRRQRNSSSMVIAYLEPQCSGLLSIQPSISVESKGSR